MHTSKASGVRRSPEISTDEMNFHIWWWWTSSTRGFVSLWHPLDGSKWYEKSVGGCEECEKVTEISSVVAKWVGRGVCDEVEVNIRLGLELNHLFLCFCCCFLAVLKLVALISASKLVIVQSAAYVRLLWKSCRGITGSTLPQSPASKSSASSETRSSVNFLSTDLHRYF